MAYRIFAGISFRKIPEGGAYEYGKNREDFSKEFLDLMVYIEETTDETAEKTDSIKIKQIHKRVSEIRKSEKAGVKYMQRWEEIEYARDDGRAEGEFNMAKQLAGSVEAAMQNFNVDLVGACKGLGYKLEEYYKAKELMAARSV